MKEDASWSGEVVSRRLMQDVPQIIQGDRRAGIARARLQGKRIGRPRVHVEAEPIIRLRNEKLFLRQIARKLDIPVSRVRRALARNAAPAGQEAM